LLALAAFLPAARFTTRLPAWLIRLVNWFNRPEQPQTSEEIEEDTIAWIDESPKGLPEPALSEPPTWAIELPPPNQSQKAGHLDGGFKSVSTTQGNDIYIRIHIPPIHLPWPRFPHGVEISLPAIHVPNSILLIVSVILAIAAQFIISRQGFIVGVLFYLASVVGLIFWARRNPKWTNVFTKQLRISPRAEILLASLLLLAIAFTRFYDIGYRVYGLEADETKWTMQSWYSTILRVDQGEFATAHYKYLPVSFWVRSIFLRVFGLNFISARIESAFLSLLSAVFLYFLVRRLTTSPPTALLSTFLYSFSFVELSESHQALHNTTVEIWMISGLYFLILAIQERKWWQFQIAGIVLALGMLTYETYFPTPVVAAVFLIGFSVYRIIKKKESVLTWLKRLLLVAWPIVFLYVIYIQDYIASQSYHFSWLVQSSNNGANISGLVQFLLKNIGDLLMTLFSRVVWTDSLINWTGPLVNPLLLVFIVIGLIYNIWNIRRPYFLFIPLWYLVNIVYAPILVGSVWPRVLYTTLGPLAIWGAMGLWTCLATLRAWFDSLKLKLSIPIFTMLLIIILFNDYQIFTSSLLDPIDRQKRRELADLTALSASNVPMVLFPYEPNQNDSLELESHIILFSVAGGRHIGLDAEKFYQQISFDQILPTLWQDRQLTGLDLFFDKSASNMQDQRSTAIQIVLKCYPGAILSISKQFFDVYHFDSKTLNQPKCYQSQPPILTSPLDGAVLTSNSPITFEWDTNNKQSTSHILTIERRILGTYWIEVEDTFQGPGWPTSSEYVNGFSGKGFLLDDWQAGTAQYSLTVPQEGQYRIWVRSYKRQQNDQYNFITIDGKKTEFATNNNTLDTWVWDDLGIYSLSDGLLPITLSRTYGKDPEYSVFIDTILITSDLVDPPDQVKIWESIVNTGEIQSPTTQYSFTEASPPGEYRWKVRIFDDDRLIDSTGAQGIDSQTSMFTVNP
jgi:4-amino-4-deoxy-L-arabinose transferase-like glycosyltransferase